MRGRLPEVHGAYSLPSFCIKSSLVGNDLSTNSIGQMYLNLEYLQKNLKIFYINRAVYRPHARVQEVE